MQQPVNKKLRQWIRKLRLRVMRDRNPNRYKRNPAIVDSFNVAYRRDDFLRKQHPKKYSPYPGRYLREMNIEKAHTADLLRSMDTLALR